MPPLKAFSGTLNTRQLTFHLQHKENQHDLFHVRQKAMKKAGRLIRERRERDEKAKSRMGREKRF